MEISFGPETAYMEGVCRGDIDAHEVVKILNAIKEESVARKQTKILIDCMEVSAPKHEIHRFIIGTEVAKILKPPIRIAFIYPEQYTNKFAETVAYNRGACMGVFSDRDEAFGWLHQN